MSHEYWATFSIYDHRSQLYRQALTLFDRAVVPVPTRPFGTPTDDEIEQLAGEVDFLAARGAAVRVD